MEGIIEVIDPGLNPILYIIFGAIALVGIILLVIGFWVDSEGFGFIGVAGVLVGVIFGLLLPPSLYSADIQTAQKAGLEKAGFENVGMGYDDSFVAETPDGEFFKGEIIHLEGNNWQVIEYVEVNSD